MQALSLDYCTSTRKRYSCWLSRLQGLMRCNTVSVRHITVRSASLDGGLDRARSSGAVTHRRRNRRDGLDRGLVLAYAAGERKGERDLELAAKSLRTNALEPR